MLVKILYPGAVVRVDDAEGQRLVAERYAVPADSKTRVDPAPPRHLVDRLHRKGCCKHEGEN